ncbi:hypothetical protein TNCV_1210931 [Trichonephila clavipes]|nr:hypothetical protein TNCV_1210931 [Trichonephila clavipes]
MIWAAIGDVIFKQRNSRPHVACRVLSYLCREGVPAPNQHVFPDLASIEMSGLGLRRNWTATDLQSLRLIKCGIDLKQYDRTYLYLSFKPSSTRFLTREELSDLRWIYGERLVPSIKRSGMNTWCDLKERDDTVESQQSRRCDFPFQFDLIIPMIGLQRGNDTLTTSGIIQWRRTAERSRSSRTAEIPKGDGDRWRTPLPMSTTQLKRKVCVSEHFRVVTATELLPENTLLLERGIPAQSYRPDGFNILTPTASLRGKDRFAIIALLEKKINPFFKEPNGKGYCVSMGLPSLTWGPTRVVEFR